MDKALLLGTAQMELAVCAYNPSTLRSEGMKFQSHSQLHSHEVQGHPHLHSLEVQGHSQLYSPEIHGHPPIHCQFELNYMGPCLKTKQKGKKDVQKKAVRGSVGLETHLARLENHCQLRLMQD